MYIKKKVIHDNYDLAENVMAWILGKEKPRLKSPNIFSTDKNYQKQQLEKIHNYYESSKDN